ncbi:uncharacterized protein il11b [Anabas testudineus]|uniref:Interleukin 11a n=1 Tax=Anabas testudineus TaxID=64144 RepID=A0A7N6FDV1_ANATE|nr:uncharacterized protein il11b [Anabas testudineus]
MKLSPKSTPGLLHLLLLAELFVTSSSRPTHSPSLYGMFGSMIAQVEKLISICKKLHGLSDEELLQFVSVDHRLHGLPRLQHTAGHLSSLKVNESLSQLYSDTQSFKLHMDWLKTAKENVSLPFKSAEDASTHLLRLSNLLNASLNQISEQVPQSLPPSLPVVSTAFDALRFSTEIADRLQIFCNWSKRVLRCLQRNCHRH